MQSAKTAGKIVLFVTVTKLGASDIYSPYAQVVRSNDGLIVRAYGRIHVYRLSDVQVTYPEGVPVGLDSIPKVNAATIDQALRNHRRLGVSDARRPGLCANCDIVLLRKSADVPVHDPWPGAKDPWQIEPGYAFWEPENDPSRKPHFTGDPVCYVYSPCGPYDGCPPIYFGCAIYYPPPAGPPPPPPDYSYSREDSFTITTPYDSTSSDVAFEDPGAGGGHGITVSSGARKIRSSAPHAPKIAALAGYCLEVHNFVSGASQLTITAQAACVGPVVLQSFSVAPHFYDFNAQGTEFGGIQPRAVSYSNVAPGGYFASVTFSPTDLIGSRIVRFDLQSNGGGPGIFIGRPSSHTVPINSFLGIYPQVFGYQGNGSKKVPFPPDVLSPPDILSLAAPPYLFQNCYGRAGAGGCYARDVSFKANVKAYYARNGWPKPVGTVDCHHIHPLAQGGGNDLGNGVLLRGPDHDKYTAWWRKVVIGFGSADPSQNDPDCP